MKELQQIADFVRGLRTQMRFGELSRAPLQLLRLQLEGETAEYDWIARPPDPWDAALPGRERDRNASLQTLLDAMALREMLFCVLPGIRSAEFRAFRQSASGSPRVVIAGTVTREAPAVLRVPSPAMRAKLYGFHFCLDDGVLRPQSSEDRTLKLVTGE
jgi:hypothetical protein